MCGICGVINFDSDQVDKNDLLNMNDQMIVRGPDDAGYYISGSFGMAMRRLSIVDLAGGHQPISNEDMSIHIVLNGEIYNHIELRKELVDRGHNFKTGSDVEVLLHLYEERGVDAIHELNGMFAFCLWDEKRKRVWIGRDRLGIKPLVYYQDSNVLIFGSTAGAITAYKNFNRAIDENSFLQYLSLSYIPTPNTIFKNIHKLAPGHTMLVENGNVNISCYWRLPDRVAIFDKSEFVSKAENLLCSSIDFRNRSDVPVGCMLSGGLDSSLVTALFCKQTKKDVHTFSMDFEGKEFSELPFAKMVSDMYKTEHHVNKLFSHQAIDLLDELLPLMDEPMGDSAIIPSYYIAKMAKENNIKVILSGSGGDELFGGYFRHYLEGNSKWTGSLSWMPQSLLFNLGRIHPLLTHYGMKLHDRGVAFGIDTSGLHLGVLQKILHRKSDFINMIEMLRERFSTISMSDTSYKDIYDRMRVDMSNYLLDNGLSILDKTTMAASIEGRVPLLDHRLVELVYSTQPDINIGKYFMNAKQQLKHISAKYLPDEIITRQKLGFNAPVSYWIEDIVQAMFNKHHVNPLFQEFFDMEYLFSLVHNKNRSNMASEILFLLVIFDHWYRFHVEDYT